MKISCLVVLFVTTYLSECIHANYRHKRQLGGYRFPGPRSSDDYASASRDSRALVKREPQYEDDYSRPAPSSQPAYRPSYQPELTDYPSRPSYSSSPSASSSSYPRENKRSQNYASSSGESSSLKKEEDEPEEEKKPSRLELLLAQSKFTCSDRKDGYYADTGLGCQIFHYCVQGAKHSWMCPEQTVFHQVHLNCVPAAQDICSQSEKFFVVNDYLHKEIDQRGPNNTIRYHQRYYPEEFLGDAALNLPTSFGYPPESSPPASRQSSAAYTQPKPRPAIYNDEADQDSPAPSYNNYRPQSYPPAASTDQHYPSSYQASPAVASRPSTSYSPSTYGPRKPSQSPSYASAFSSLPAYSTPAPTASYRPVSSGLRYAQSSGSPIRSYPSVPSSRAAVTPTTYSSVSRPTQPSYHSSPTQPSYHSSPTASVYKTPSSSVSSRYPLSLPSYASSSQSASPRNDYPAISPSYESRFSRFNSAFSASDIPSRYRTGVTYESDY